MRTKMIRAPTMISTEKARCKGMSSIPLAVGDGLFFALDFTIVHPLGYGLDIVDIPKEFGIASMGGLMVGDGTIRGRRLCGAKLACALACVIVAEEHGLAQILPCGCIVPSTPWLEGPPLLVGIVGGIADQRRQR
ncbi:hypothetical protein GOB34_14330 [Sinorhizobium meliloti]|nr:hypothetical protein [Sinorhizobium meliloti]